MNGRWQDGKRWHECGLNGSGKASNGEKLTASTVAIGRGIEHDSLNLLLMRLNE